MLVNLLSSLSSVKMVKKSLSVSRQIKEIKKEMEQLPNESVECFLGRMEDVQRRYRTLTK